MRARKAGQGTLARRFEQPLGRELLAQQPQRTFERPQTLGLDLLDHQLVTAARSVHVEVALADDFQAVVQFEACRRGRVAPA